MTQGHIVLRPVPGPEGLIPSGTPVNAGQWRNLDKLVAQRYLRPATPEEAATLGTEKQVKKVKEKANGN